MHCQPPHRSVVTLAVLLFGGLAAAVGCTCQAKTPSSPTSNAPAPGTEKAPCTSPNGAALAAFGDVHGDVGAARAALRLIGAIDDQDHWKGGVLHVVQTGDFLDRGDDDRQVLDLFVRLREEARRAGGSFFFLIGNHELMNAEGDLRYASPVALAAFRDYPGLDLNRPELAGHTENERARAAAFLPGGPAALELAKSEVVHIEGETLFAHGGVLPSAAASIEAINAQAKAFFRGMAPSRELLDDQRGPLWSRDFGAAEGTVDCAALKQTLALTKTRRMVIGHTTQPGGITSACDGRVYRIDVGMSRTIGGTIAAIVIDGPSVRVLSSRDGP